MPYQELSEIQIIIDDIVTLFLNDLITDEEEKGWLLLSHFILRFYMNTRKNCSGLTR